MFATYERRVWRHLPPAIIIAELMIAYKMKYTMIAAAAGMIVLLLPLSALSFAQLPSNNVLISKPKFTWHSENGRIASVDMTLGVAAEYTGPQRYLTVLQVVDADGYIASIDTKGGMIDSGGQFQNVTMSLHRSVTTGEVIDIFVVDDLDNPTLFGAFKYNIDQHLNMQDLNS